MPPSPGSSLLLIPALPRPGKLLSTARHPKPRPFWGGRAPFAQHWGIQAWQSRFGELGPSPASPSAVFLEAEAPRQLRAHLQGCDPTGGWGAIPPFGENGVGAAALRFGWAGTVSPKSIAGGWRGSSDPSEGEEEEGESRAALLPVRLIWF